jgi:two-component system NtrC family sensor kinase
MEQVFGNLIRNAVWATSPAGRLTVTTAVQPPGGLLTVTFTDDGRGIPEGDLERIFDPFFTTRLGQGGTGLGLSISRRIVEEMGGTITATSVPGRTSFVIRLPV